MKFFLATLLVAIMVALAMAASDLKSIIVSYPKGTPTSELDELKKAIDEAVCRRHSTIHMNLDQSLMSYS